MGGSQNKGYCCACNARIVGAPFVLNGKNYCGACYQKEMQARAEEERQKRGLYDYIKTLFGIRSCPDCVVHAIERMISEGKKLTGIRYTVYYYYELLGNPILSAKIVDIPWVIRDFYEEARDYAIKVSELAKENALVDIKTEPVKVKIKEPARRKRVYRHWDNTED